MRRKIAILVILLLIASCSRGSKVGYPAKISGPAGTYLEGAGIEEAQAAVAAGLAGSPGSALLHYLDGDVKYLAGDFQEASVSFFDAVEDASRQPDQAGDILGVLSISTLDTISRYIPDYEGKLSLAIERTFADLYRNSDEAYFAMLAQKIKQLRRMGKFDEALAAGKEGGCIQDWLKTGPFGATELMGFDSTYPPEVELPWREVYTLREGEDPQAVRKADTEACWTSLGSEGISRGGAFYGLARLDAARKVDLALKIASFDPAALQIDGVEVASFDRRTEILPNALIVDVSLDPGIHHVVVKISSRSASPLFMLQWKEAASPGSGGPGASGVMPMPPDPAAVPVAPPPTGGAIREMPEPASDIDRLLLTDMCITLGIAMRARPMIEALQKKFPHSFTVVSRTMLVEGLDSTIPFNLRMNRTKAESQDMKKHHADAWMSYMFLSQLESQAGRLEDAARIVKEGIAGSPLYPGFFIELADLYDQLGWPGESIDALRTASAKFKGTCAQHSVDFHLASKFNDPVGMEKAAKLIQSCDATDRTFIGVLVSKEKWSEAHEEQLRLLHGYNDDRWLLMDAGWSSFKIGDIEGFRKTLEKALDEDSSTLMEALKLADLLAYEGKQDEAKKQLFGALVRSGGPPSFIHQKIAAAQDFQYLFHYRRSFEEAVASFNTVKQASYENTPSVEVLDHVTHRIYPDGSSLTRYHSIRKLMTKEGVEKNGEFAVPENAVMLKVHTIKPDGTVLEPEKIYGKPTISYPVLEPGDFTETEWVQYQTPSAIYPGGTDLERWYFQVPDMVLHRSEMYLITPADMKVDLNSRGQLPKQTVVEDSGLKIYSWTVQQSPHIKFEPNSPNLNEFLPSVQVTYRTSWDGYVEWIRDLLIDTFVVTPDMKEALKEMISSVPIGSDSEKTKAIYRWVCDEIEDEEGLTSPVSFIFHHKRGDRTKLLYALLTAAGVPAELHLAETIYADKTATSVPDFNKYTHFLIWTGKDWLMPSVKKAYFGFLPYPVYDQDTLRIFPKTGKGHVPKSAFSGDEVRQTLKIEVDAGGTCTCDLTLIFDGANAALMRDMLRNVPKGDIKNQIESSFLAANFPGASLMSLDLPDLEKPERTLTMSVQFTAPAQSGPMPGSLVLGPILKSQVAARWTQLPARSFPLLVDDLVNITTHAEIDGKGLWKIVSPPKPQAGVGMGPDISFTQKTDIDKKGSKLTLTRSLKIPIGRIPPSKYHEFLIFAGSADEAEGGVYLLMPAK